MLAVYKPKWNASLYALKESIEQHDQHGERAVVENRGSLSSRLIRLHDKSTSVKQSLVKNPMDRMQDCRDALAILDRRGWNRSFHQRLFHEDFLVSIREHQQTSHKTPNLFSFCACFVVCGPKLRQIFVFSAQLAPMLLFAVLRVLLWVF